MDAKSSKYETIWSAEDPDQEEFLSETDVDVSNEKTWHSGEGRNKPWKQQPRGIIHTIKKHRWLIDISLLAVIVVLLVILLLREPVTPQPPRQVGSDFTGSKQQSECTDTLLRVLLRTDAKQ